MTKTLDKTRPYGQVFGLEGIAFEQDYCRFNAAGVMIGEDPNKPKTVVHKPAKETAENEEAQPEETEEQDDEDSDAPDYNAMPAAEVKALVESYGGEYKNKIQGIEFLTNRA